MFQLQVIELSQVVFNPGQPRTDAAATDIASLAASMGSSADPVLAQLPVVFPVGGGRFMVQAGERRIRSAQELGASELQVLVLDSDTSPIERHRLSLLENLHREDLRTLDEAVAFKIYYLHQNAAAVGQQAEADKLMVQGSPPLVVLQGLQWLLEACGWQRLKPPVTYEQCLAGLGLTLNRSALMRRLRVLNLEIDVIERIQSLPDLTEAAIRVIGKLDVEAQRLLLDAIIETPEIAKNVRRICSTVGAKTYTIREAIAEARGEVYLEPAPGDEGESKDADHSAAPAAPVRKKDAAAAPGVETPGRHAPNDAVNDEQLEPLAMQLLDVATTIDTTLQSLKTILGKTRINQGQTGMWGDTLRETITLIQQSLAEWDVS